MATKRIYYSGTRGRRDSGRWRARVKMDWVEYHIGDFDTKEEAEKMEENFRKAWVYVT